MIRAPLTLSDLGLLAILSSGCEGGTAAAPASSSAAGSDSSTAAASSAPAPAAAPSASASAVAAGPALTATPEAAFGAAPPDLGLKVGEPAPTATLLDAAGEKVDLAALYAKGPTYVVFYRGGWCPFCNLQLHALAKAQKDFEAKGVQLVAVSVDQPNEEAKTQAKQGAPFPFLSDSDLALHKAFRVVHTPDAAEKAKFDGYGIKLEGYSGKDHGSFAVPSVFLIDKKGIVRLAHVDPEYKTRPTPQQMLAAL